MLVGEPIGEERRMALMNRLTEILGEEEARTIMESLPPIIWHDIATKGDLKALEERLGVRFDKVDARFEQVDARFEKVDGQFERLRGYIDLQLAKAIRTMVFTVAGFSLAIMGTVLGVGLS